MPSAIEGYALIGDTHAAALVGRDGSIDWLCLPRFDSAAIFAALLGEPGNGRWRLAPVDDAAAVNRRYLPDTLVLETEYATASGAVRVVDCMPIRTERPTAVVRRVEGLRGRVRMRSEMIPRFGYGRVTPRLHGEGDRVRAVAGPDAVTLAADVPHGHAAGAAVAEFVVESGQHFDFRLGWAAPGHEPPGDPSAEEAIDQTCTFWRRWIGRSWYRGPHREAVVRSLITLKALIYAPSGGIVAAATTSLPEQLGGPRNWDYRYCWIRDATLTLLALLHAGYEAEAKAWREWLLRTVTDRPRRIQIMYGVNGEHRLSEEELDWLAGYADSRPVRAGNSASEQFQLDVYGELMDALHQARAHGIAPDEDAWMVQRRLLDFLESAWHEPDNGIWEVRGHRRHFTHSKVMAWTAVDRGIKAVERLGLDGPLDRWRRVRQDIFDEVCDRGFDPTRNTFTQFYGSSSVDAALLLLAPVGFLPATDERIVGTVAAVEKELCRDGYVWRYDNADNLDAMPSGEGAFLPCSFWLADNYLLAGRVDEGRALFERLLDLRTDLGLLAEEYDPTHRRLLGNFPQALSHLALVNTALDLRDAGGPTRRRATG